MSGPQPNSGRAWSPRVFVSVVTLTGVGMIGVVVAFFGGIAAAGGRLAPGCGGGIGILFVVLFGLAVIWFFVGLIALVGAILFWFRPQWGAMVLILINLLSLYLIAGYQTVYAGEVVWGLVVVLFAAVPVIAIGLLARTLLTRGQTWLRALQLVVLGVLAVPVLLTVGPGLAVDLGSAATPAPPPAPAAHAGCGATTGFVFGRL